MTLDLARMVVTTATNVNDPLAVCSTLYVHDPLSQKEERSVDGSQFTIIGIDEQTALVSSAADSAWEVRGRGAVTFIRDDLKPARYAAGERIVL